MTRGSVGTFLPATSNSSTRGSSWSGAPTCRSWAPGRSPSPTPTGPAGGDLGAHGLREPEDLAPRDVPRRQPEAPPALSQRVRLPLRSGVSGSIEKE